MDKYIYDEMGGSGKLVIFCEGGVPQDVVAIENETDTLIYVRRGAKAVNEDLRIEDI